MTTSLETIIRPFQTTDVTPTPYHPAGVAGVPPVRVSIGLKGGQKTFSFSGNSTVSTYMTRVFNETGIASFDLHTLQSSADGGS